MLAEVAVGQEIALAEALEVLVEVALEVLMAVVAQMEL
jgi:hypothetical protein